MLNIEQMHYNVFTSKCYLSAVPRRSARPAPAGSPRVARRRREAALDLRCDRIRSTTVPAPLDAGASRGTRVCRACRACIRGTRSSFCLRGRRVRCRDSGRRLCGDCGGGWLSAVAPRLGFSAPTQQAHRTAAPLASAGRRRPHQCDAPAVADKRCKAPQETTTLWRWTVAPVPSCCTRALTCSIVRLASHCTAAVALACYSHHACVWHCCWWLGAETDHPESIACARAGPRPPRSYRRFRRSSCRRLRSMAGSSW